MHLGHPAQVAWDLEWLHIHMISTGRCCLFVWLRSTKVEMATRASAAAASTVSSSAAGAAAPPVAARAGGTPESASTIVVEPPPPTRRALSIFLFLHNTEDTCPHGQLCNRYCSDKHMLHTL
jgi:hypothetical protein